MQRISEFQTSRLSCAVDRHDGSGGSGTAHAAGATFDRFYENAHVPHLNPPESALEASLPMQKFRCYVCKATESPQFMR